MIDAGPGLLKKDAQAIPDIIKNLEEFLRLSTAGGVDKETDNAIRATAAALVSSREGDMDGKVAAYSRLLGLTRSRVAAAIAQRAQALAPDGGCRPVRTK